MSASGPSSTTGKPRSPFGGNTARVVASLLIGGGFLWLLMRGGLPLLPSSAALSHLPWWTVGAYVGLQIVCAFLRNYRWIYLIRPIAPTARPLRVLGIAMVGFSAIFLAPLRSGEIVRPYLLSQDKQVSFMQAAGTVGAERVIDGLLVTLFTFIGLSLAQVVSPLPHSLGDLPLPVSAVPTAVYGALLVFTCVFVVMTAFYFARDFAGRLVRSVVGLVSKRAADWAAGTLERVADGLSFLPSSTNLVPFLLQTLGYWGLGIGAQWVLLRGLGLDASLAQAATCVGVQGLGTLAPAGPGMFGAYQIAGFSALAMFFPMDMVKQQGAVFIFITYTAQLALNSLQFVVGFWLMSKVKPVAAAPPA